MATAISGSGPAYIFLLMEAMIDAGVHMGKMIHLLFFVDSSVFTGLHFFRIFKVSCANIGVSDTSWFNFVCYGNKRAPCGFA